MEHAPLKPLLQQASDAIVKGNVIIQPQVGGGDGGGGGGGVCGDGAF